MKAVMEVGHAFFVIALTPFEFLEQRIYKGLLGCHVLFEVCVFCTQITQHVFIVNSGVVRVLQPSVGVAHHNAVMGVLVVLARRLRWLAK